MQIISPDQARQIMSGSTPFILLDVRDEFEWQEERIPGSINIPYMQLEQDAEDMLPDPDAQILIYCRSGRRALIAAEVLDKLNYTNVSSFGGIEMWPYEKESGLL